MTEEEKLINEHRMTEVEARSKSNTHRLDQLEPVVKEIHTMSATMVKLVQEVKHTNKAVSSLDEKVERMDSRVDEMERTPGREAASAKKIILEKVLGGIITFLLAGLIWAAVQAF